MTPINVLPPPRKPETYLNLDEQLRLLVDSVQDYAIFMLDPGGYIASWNPGAQRINGYTADEIIGQHFSKFYTEEDLATEKPKRELEIATATGKYEEEGWRLRKDGTRFWTNVVITAVRDESGKLIGFGKVTRDLSDRREAEEELKRRSRELAQANRELESFSYSISHDLRAPLRAVNGFATMLEAELSDPSPQAKEYLRLIRESGNKMGKLVDDLLAFSRLGRQSITRVPINMRQLAEDVSRDLKSTRTEREIEVQIEAMPDALGEPSMLRQVFVNLISNAMKFSKYREKAVIKIAGRRDGNRNFYTVQDNGAGFDMRYAKHLFGVFQRLHREEDFEGTGVGLALVQRIVNRHGGEITAQSEPDHGATFTFSLPAEKP